MPYQEHHVSEFGEDGLSDDLGAASPFRRDPNAARNIQIMVVVGLVLAVLAAVFASL